jgi:hypothetical protein
VEGKALDGHSNIAVETGLDEAFKKRFKVERFLNRSLWVFSPEVVHRMCIITFNLDIV